jgi:hypothetical protein
MATTAASARNIGVPGGTSRDDDMDKLFFRVSDLARMWGEENARARARKAGLDEAAAVAAAKPVKDRTVLRAIQECKTGRYAVYPMPMPTYPDGEEPKRGQHPLWVPADGETLDGLERRIRGWLLHSRPGQGVGGGRPRKAPAQRVPCPCGCGEQVAPGTMCDRAADRGVRSSTR